MFKDHLVNSVTNSLTDLSDFIHRADQGLLQIVEDYETLVSIMAFLLQVKERGKLSLLYYISCSWISFESFFDNFWKKLNLE